MTTSNPHEQKQPSSFRDLIQFNIIPNSASSGINSPSALQDSPNDAYSGKNLPTPELISSSGLSMNTPDFVRSVNEHIGANANTNTTPASSTSSTTFSLTPNGMGFNFSSTPPTGRGQSIKFDNSSIKFENTAQNGSQVATNPTQYVPAPYGAGATGMYGSGDFADYDTGTQQHDMNGAAQNGAAYYAHHVMQQQAAVQLAAAQAHAAGNSAPLSQGATSTTQSTKSHARTTQSAPAFFTSSPSTHSKSHSMANGNASSSGNATDGASDADDDAVIRLIEGLVNLPQAKYPGGKGNTRNPIPRQVVELDITKLPAAVNEQELLLQSEVLGFDKRVNGMVPIGILSPLQPFEKTSDGKYLSTYDNCILRFSSHSHGQKLALRWTLFSGGKRVCSIDSCTFQTITERGIKKQNMRLAEKSGTGHSKLGFKNANKLEKKRKMKKWTLGEVRILIDAIEKHGEEWAQILSVTDGLDECRTEQMLQKKYKQLLES